MADFRYDVAARRYRDPSGRFVPEAAIRQAVDTVVDVSGQRVAVLAERLQAGALDVATFQQQMAAELKAVHLATASAAQGGWAMMSPADFGWTGQRLRVQYAYLRAWTGQLADGTAPLDGRTVARAKLYAAASRQTFEEMGRRTERLRGGIEERRVLRSGESCTGCVSQADRGWQPAGVLPPLGSEQCRTNCKCVWETRPARQVAA